MDFTNPLVYGAPAFIAFILVELTYSKTHGKEDLYDWKDFAASSAMGIGSAILGPLLKVVLLVVLFEYAYEFFNPLVCLLYTSPSPRDLSTSRMPSSA